MNLAGEGVENNVKVDGVIASLVDIKNEGISGAKVIKETIIDRRSEIRGGKRHVHEDVALLQEQSFLSWINVDNVVDEEFNEIEYGDESDGCNEEIESLVEGALGNWNKVVQLDKRDVVAPMLFENML